MDRFEPDTGDYELFFQIKKNILFWKKILSFIHRNSLPAYYQLQRKTTPPTIWNMPGALLRAETGEILGLKYDSFDLEAGTVTICGLHARNYVSADREWG